MRLRIKYSLALLLLCGAAFAQSSSAWYYARAKLLEKKQPDSALIYFSQALAGLRNTRDDSAAYCYSRMGSIFMDRSNLQKAFSNNLAALNIVEKLKDTTSIISLNNSLAIILNQQRKYKEAIRYTKTAIELARKGRRDWHIMNCLVNLADMLAATGKSDSSIKVLKEAEQIAKAKHFETDIPNILANLGNIYYGKAEALNDKTFFGYAASCSQQAIDLLLTMKNPERVVDDYRKDLAYSYGLNGAAQAGLGNYAAAEAAYEKAIAYYTMQNDLFDLSYLYYELTQVYLNSNKNQKAITCLRRYDSVSRALYTGENTRAISDMQTKYETEKKEQQNIALQKQNDLSLKTIRQQKMISYFIIGGLVMLGCFAAYVLRANRQKQRSYEIIAKQKQEVELQKHLLEEKQKEILDSITYAQRIQRSLLTSEKYIERNLTKLMRS